VRQLLAGDTSLTRYLYTAREFDATTGLQYNRNRWYDAHTGRWLSEDPIGFASDPSNLYRYVGNSPTNFRDPSGLIGPQEPWNWPPGEPKPQRPVKSPYWRRQAERRRGHGPWGDSAQHCWAACYFGAVYGIGNIVALSDYLKTGLGDSIGLM
jgi:RHS repeat-associated protein